MKVWRLVRNRYPQSVWVRFIGEFIINLSGGMLAPYLILYINHQLGGHLLISMIVIGMGPLSEIMVTVIGGRLTDRIGRKRIITFSVIFQSLVMVGFMGAHGILLIAGLYILNGMCRSLYIPAARAQLVDVTEPNQRAEIFAVLSTIGSIGFTLGPALGYIVYISHPVMIFGFQGATLFLYSCLYLKWIPETSPCPLNPVQTAHCPSKKRRFPIHCYRTVLTLMALTLPISFFHAQSETNYRIYLSHLFTHYLSVLALLSTANSLMMLCLEIILVKWSERYSMRIILVITYSCYACVALLYAFSASLWLLMLAQLILTIGQTIGLNHLQRYVSELAPANERGLYFAIFGSHWDLSRMIGPFIGSVLMLHFGGAVLFVVTACLLVAGGIGQYWFTTKSQSTLNQQKISEATPR
ncbi:MFS transporter [Pullulanibacillus sp. KACC 23026]|uniref:MDR family MFS transporter n=1 Tax=Pullulanibacillus sp. KACC 23026 TaxID=3028315 RepID=UPI0023B06AD9|nr:MFS transporter [Pullulanibacillus sp. KACC 23026]WEG11846.1 MFS transporter [Pullulanibacillus sp. KACC 23026]